MRTRLSLIFITSLVTLSVASSALANAASANISSSYQSSTTIPNGSIVSLDPKRSNYAKQADINNSSSLLGVVVAANDSLLAVNPSAEKVQVATAGSASVLVSNLNGNINVGDEISVSPFEGIGMKAQANSKDIGLAQTTFNSSTPGLINEQVKDKTGHSSTIKVGYVKLNIALSGSGNSGGSSLTSLQKIALSITGHVVSTIRVTISLGIAIVALLAIITLIYASISSSIVSIGRNPLAKHAIYRNLTSVLIMTLVMSGLSVVSIFFLLR